MRAESQKLADGVWLIAGGTHNSVAVDFRDFVTVIEAPLNEERSLAVIGEVSRLIPNKPIRYVVNTHHHFDHSGGLRTYLAQGATIVTPQANREYYEQVLFNPAPRTLQPDRFSTFYPYFAGVDIRKVVETGIAPLINTGMAGKVPGTGQIGAGVVRAPLACFEEAVEAFAAAAGAVRG